MSSHSVVSEAGFAETNGNLLGVDSWPTWFGVPDSREVCLYGRTGNWRTLSLWASFLWKFQTEHEDLEVVSYRGW